MTPMHRLSENSQIGYLRSKSYIFHSPQQLIKFFHLVVEFCQQQTRVLLGHCRLVLLNCPETIGDKRSYRRAFNFFSEYRIQQKTYPPQWVHLNSWVVKSNNWSASRSVNCSSHWRHRKLLLLVASLSSVSIFLRIWSSLYFTMFTNTCFFSRCKIISFSLTLAL